MPKLSYADAVRLNLPAILRGYNSCASRRNSVGSQSTISSSSSNRDLTRSELINLIDNWSSRENMQQFLQKADIASIEQLNLDYYTIYSEILVRGDGQDVSRWICKGKQSDGYLYERRPMPYFNRRNRRKLNEENRTIYKKILIDNSRKIRNVE